MEIMRKAAHCAMVKWGPMRVGLSLTTPFDGLDARWYVKERPPSDGNDDEL